MMRYKEIVAPLANVPIQKQDTRINEYYLDKHNDIVVCNNIFAGVPTDGHIFPKEFKSETLELLEQTIPSAYIETNSGDSFSQWISKTVREMDLCCSNSIAYTWQWGNIIDACINMDIIPPAVYSLVYSMLRSMSRSPPLPVGTKLYFEQSQLSKGFLECSVDNDTGLCYTVREGDYIHGLWFDKNNGTSVNDERTIVIGPDMYIDQDLGDGNVILKQNNFGSYFMINYNEMGDETYYNVLKFDCVCYSDGEDNHCIIDYKLAKWLHIPNAGNVHYQYSVPAEQLAALYIAVQENQITGLDLDRKIGKPFSLRGYGIKNNKTFVFKVIWDDNHFEYCTAMGLLYICCLGEMVDITSPEDNIEGIILDSTNKLDEEIEISI